MKKVTLIIAALLMVFALQSCFWGRHGGYHDGGHHDEHHDDRH